MDEIEVTARYDENGKPFPTLFRWKDQSYRVDSVGRRWEDGVGEHILVLVPGGRVYELLLSSADDRWYLNPFGPELGKI
jgi:hypothetical protein